MPPGASSTLIEPLTIPQDAGALALQMASAFALGDPSLPDDAPARQMLARCRDYQVCPPGEGWLGVHRMEGK